MVLFVEDAAGLGEMYLRTLRRIGFRNAVVTQTLDEARRILAGKQVKQVISDWKLTRESGDEFLLQVRKRHPGTDCVLLTGFAEELSAERARTLELAGVSVCDKNELSTKRLAELIGYSWQRDMSAESSDALEQPQSDTIAEQRLRIEELRQSLDHNGAEIVSPDDEAHALIAELGSIPMGVAGASEFEQWCYRALKLCFGAGLQNFELHPNRQAVQRRDVVATNLCGTKAWRRVYEDYRTRQVVFEIKNTMRLTVDDYRQVMSYLSSHYGHVGFIVNRDPDSLLHSKHERSRVRELYWAHGALVVKLGATHIAELPTRCLPGANHADAELNALLDRYVREYLAEGT